MGKGNKHHLKESQLDVVTTRHMPSTYRDPLWPISARQELRDIKHNYSFHNNYKLLRHVHKLMQDALALPIIHSQYARSGVLRKYLLSKLKSIRKIKHTEYPEFYEYIMLRELTRTFTEEGQTLKKSLLQKDYFVFTKIAHSFLERLPKDKGGKIFLGHKRWLLLQLISIYTTGTGKKPKYKWLPNDNIYSGSFYLFLLDINELFKMVAGLDLGTDETIGQYLKKIGTKKLV